VTQRSYLTFLTFPTFLTFLTLLCACSPAEKTKAVDWRRVPVSIELRLAERSPAAGLVPAVVHGQSNTLYLHRDPQLSNTDITRVEATKARIGQGLILDVWLTRDGARRMADLSRRHMGSKLAVLIDSVVVSVPTIQDTLDLGTGVPFEIGVPLGPEETVQLARAVSQTWPARKGRT
jgi:preprotein translocase subunit SecD